MIYRIYNVIEYITVRNNSNNNNIIENNKMSSMFLIFDGSVLCLQRVCACACLVYFTIYPLMMV